MDKQNRPCWATEVKNLLFRNGFGYAWIHQEVGNEVGFLKSFVQRISDIYRQKWFSDINESPKLSTYSQFKSLPEPENICMLSIVFGPENSLQNSGHLIMT